MKKKFWLLPLLACVLMLTGCGKSLSDQSVLDNVKESNTITWGVIGDVKLYGLIDVRDGQQKGFDVRSEERRVGKECRSRRTPTQ